MRGRQQLAAQASTLVPPKVATGLPRLIVVHIKQCSRPLAPGLIGSRVNIDWRGSAPQVTRNSSRPSRMSSSGGTRKVITAAKIRLVTIHENNPILKEWYVRGPKTRVRGGATRSC